MIAPLLVFALIACGSSGLPGLFLAPDDSRGQRIASALSVAGSLAGLAVCAQIFRSGASLRVELPWPLPFGPAALAVDALAAIFLAPIFLVSALGAIYGESYWPQREHPENGRMLRFFYGVLTVSVALVFAAGNWIVFLFGWEIMAIAAFLLVSTEEEDASVREAGWIYLVSTHVGALAVFGLVALVACRNGSFEIAGLPAGLAASRAGTALFFLALVGFGFKAGIMPMHIWLPPAHASAPSHVSAIMSGVLIKTGIYGLFRFFSLFPDPPLWWGAALLALGLVSGVFGVAYALGQHDLKRLLAYHSIENIGIIVMGLGLGMAGRSLGHPSWIALGFGGALLHVVNHAIFKALLFYAAGAVIHATGTREIDRLGGLAKRMPGTALAFLVGAVAICGLPPLNGFVSELFIFVGFFDAIRSAWFWGGLAAPGLALIGALATACFVKAYGAVFLGSARTEIAAAAPEAGASMRTPFVVLGALCVLIGAAPFLVAPLFDQAASCVSRTSVALPNLSDLVPLPMLSIFAAALAMICGGTAFFVLPRRAEVPAVVTWDCGYAAPTPRMQYTASSFADVLVRLFRRVLRPEEHAPRLAALFPARAFYESHVPDAVLDHLVRPFFSGAERMASWARLLQQGRIQVYLLYVAITLLVLLAFV